MVRFTCSILAIFAVSFLYPETASAQCTCAKPNITALEEFTDATVVFTGETTDIQKSTPDAQHRYYETARMVVDRVWKENIDSIVTIKNYVYGCVQGWKVGDKY